LTLVIPAACLVQDLVAVPYFLLNLKSKTNLEIQELCKSKSYRYFRTTESMKPEP
jgi:hypothetical protein